MTAEPLAELHDEVEMTWRRYWRYGRLDDRNFLLLRYRGIAVACAKQCYQGYVTNYVTLDDMVSYGVIGLMDAIERFDPSRGTDFKTYAFLRVRGAIIDELRADSSMDRFRTSWFRRIDAALDQLAAAAVIDPSAVQTAEVMGVSEATYRTQLLRIRASGYQHSIDEMRESTGESDSTLSLIDMLKDDSISAEEHFEHKETIAELRSAISKLAPRSRYVFVEHVLRERTLRLIGEDLGVTESRACQIFQEVRAKLTKALSKLNSDEIGMESSMNTRLMGTTSLDKRYAWSQLEARLSDEEFMPHECRLFRVFFGEKVPNSVEQSYLYQWYEVLQAIPEFRLWLQVREDNFRAHPVPRPEPASPPRPQPSPAARVSVPSVEPVQTHKPNKSGYKLLAPGWKALESLYRDGSVEDSDGKATRRLAERLDRSNQMTALAGVLTGLTDKNLIDRRINGKRCLSIALTEIGEEICRNRFGPLVTATVEPTEVPLALASATDPELIDVINAVEADAVLGEPTEAFVPESVATNGHNGNGHHPVEAAVGVATDELVADAAPAPLFVLTLGREGEELDQEEIERGRQVLDLVAELSCFPGFRKLTLEQRIAIFRD